MFVVTRFNRNPIVAPEKNNTYESFATFNPNPIVIGKNIHILYRAQSSLEHFDAGSFSLSSICRAVSTDGFSFKKGGQFIVPEEVWERYGCEDPRVTKIGSKYFIFYTALSVFPFAKEGIKVGLAISKDLKTVSEKHLVTPFNAKAMTLFPEKINGKYVALFTVHPEMPPASVGFAEFTNTSDIWSAEYWNKWYKNQEKNVLHIPHSDTEQIEIGASPIKTKDGWLLVYARVQNYLSEQKVFGIECVLLDLKNPKKIIGQTKGPILLPEEQYEKYGAVPNVIFPSGAIVKKGVLHIYYGATDTTCAVATVTLSDLLNTLTGRLGGLTRLSKKPILLPEKKGKWQERAVFNPAAVLLKDTVHILYRAMSMDNTSTVGYASSKDGVTINERLPDPIYSPRTSIEEKRIPNGNSGCEDPRLTQIGDTIYMYYTAYNGVNPPQVAMSSINEKDFLNKKWNWTLPVPVTADGVDDKDTCLHPEKVKGKYFLFHRVDNHICGDFGSTPAFPERNNFRNIPILYPRKGMWDSKKVGMSVPPIKTKKGWLMIYHGVSDDGVYRVGAILLDLKDPTVVLSRTTDFIFEPHEQYEEVGQINHVVFPCGAVIKKDMLYVYYGGADSVVNVAGIQLKTLLDSMV